MIRAYKPYFVSHREALRASATMSLVYWYDREFKRAPVLEVLIFLVFRRPFVCVCVKERISWRNTLPRVSWSTLRLVRFVHEWKKHVFSSWRIWMCTLQGFLNEKLQGLGPAAATAVRQDWVWGMWAEQGGVKTGTLHFFGSTYWLKYCYCSINFF